MQPTMHPHDPKRLQWPSANLQPTRWLCTNKWPQCHSTHPHGTSYSHTASVPCSSNPKPHNPHATNVCRRRGQPGHGIPTERRRLTRRWMQRWMQRTHRKRWSRPYTIRKLHGKSWAWRSHIKPRDNNIGSIQPSTTEHTTCQSASTQHLHAPQQLEHMFLMQIWCGRWAHIAKVPVTLAQD